MLLAKKQHAVHIKVDVAAVVDDNFLVNQTAIQ